MSTLLVASVCPKMAVLDPEKNFDSLCRWTLKARQAKADLVFFPETFLSGYAESFMLKKLDLKRFHKLAEPVPGLLTQKLSKLSRENRIHLCCGMRELAGKKIYNTQILIHPQKGLVGKYRKVHVGAGESWMADPGDEYPVFDILGVRTGIMTCRDKSFPEAARILALKGAKLLLAPHSTSESRDKKFTDWSLRMCMGRAMENGCFVIANNNIYDWRMPLKNLQAGYSFAIDPYGKVIHCDSGRGDREKLALIRIDTKFADVRRKWEGKHFNLWSRRPSTYKSLII